MAPAKPEARTLDIPAIEIDTYRIRIVGLSPLCTHAWSAKAKREMLDKQMGKARNKKEHKDPQADYEAAFYRLPDGRAAFPTIAFKAAVVSAARQVEGLTMTFLRGAFHVVGDLVAIDGTPEMNEAMVRVGMGTADIRFRPLWQEWVVTLTARVNRHAITIEQLVHLFNQAGFSVGVGEWRPEKNGSWGMFAVEGITRVGAEVTE